MDGVNWEGGQIEVVKEGCGGWGIVHRTVDGGEYPLGWERYMNCAVRYARTIAEKRGAKLLMELTVEGK